MVMMKHPNIHSSARHYLIHVNKRSEKSYSGGEVGEPAPQQAGWQGGVRACCLLAEREEGEHLGMWRGPGQWS